MIWIQTVNTLMVFLKAKRDYSTSQRKCFLTVHIYNACLCFAIMLMYCLLFATIVLFNTAANQSQVAARVLKRKHG